MVDRHRRPRQVAASERSEVTVEVEQPGFDAFGVPQSGSAGCGLLQHGRRVVDGNDRRTGERPDERGGTYAGTAAEIQGAANLRASIMKQARRDRERFLHQAGRQLAFVFKRRELVFVHTAIVVRECRSGRLSCQ